MSTAGECGISHVLPGDRWLPAVTPHQGRPCHLLQTDHCSPFPTCSALPRSGLACGYFCTQPPTHALVAPGDADGGSHCWILGHSRAKRDRRRVGSARPVPERRLPVKLVSTGRLSLAPVSPHKAVSKRRQGAQNIHQQTNWSEVKTEAGQRGLPVRGRGQQGGAAEVELPVSMQSSL